ncbi:hypothetical protein BDP81DRAFT_492243 [Colletotrichum phormii]|uniref:Uncharacterized protein n=1 Tax=Colletotrichum phormii TaxID=359342 RepID=A0AAI9ZNS5_9PEZI|nr:uncharacterized protein BDP81DRAFT_492243 [Colletotrichum phormii]KAK1635389.1 hypothetical protein BDP81DRAFT_492243 [Colletotrichum phormii]
MALRYHWAMSVLLDYLYSVTYRAKFDRNKHLQEDKELDVYLGVWRAKNQMHWYLRRCFPEEPSTILVPITTYREDVSSFSVGICECDATELPDWRTYQINSCYIDYKLDVQFWKLPNITTIDGTTAKKMTYEVEMISSGSSMEFAV